MSQTVTSDVGERLQSDSPVEDSGEVSTLLEALDMSLSGTRLPYHESRLIQQLLAVLQSMNRRMRKLEQDLEQYREREEDAKSQTSLLRQKEEENLVKTAQLEGDEQRINGKEGASPKWVATSEKRPTTKAVIHQESHTFLAFGGAKRRFNANPARIIWSTQEYPTELDIDIYDKRVKQLRLHDHYKGWLDCMTSLDDVQAWSDGKSSWNDMEYLFDRKDTRSPLNAGRNVGLILGWSAICTENDMPQHDTHLDDRVWRLNQLSPKSDHISGSGRDFWRGVKWGTETAQGLFNMKAKNVIWDTKEDPMQVEYLTEECRKDREREHSL
ncbi:hypothetical protein E8E13_006887 [Curvularia kusanoi]|uniref:Uncharacterized protein n=1 Tax=Curvularia kusanoi TaxID=90978 RepID=A0A9P4TNH8_CURKU|nr:hypothetical protein E8E13_006887 [Curvularia kusanoi]